MNYKQVLKQIKPFRSPITNKTYLAIVGEDGIIKEKEEFDLEYWLLCLAEMKRQVIGTDIYELNFPQFGYKLKVEIEEKAE